MYQLNLIAGIICFIAAAIRFMTGGDWKFVLLLAIINFFLVIVGEE